jgi:hypothetical protein
MPPKKKLSEWNRFVKCNAGKGHSIKQLAVSYKKLTGKGLSGGRRMR